MFAALRIFFAKTHAAQIRASRDDTTIIVRGSSEYTDSGDTESVTFAPFLRFSGLVRKWLKSHCLTNDCKFLN